MPGREQSLKRVDVLLPADSGHLGSNRCPKARTQHAGCTDEPLLDVGNAEKPREQEDAVSGLTIADSRLRIRGFGQVYEKQGVTPAKLQSARDNRVRES